MSFNPYLFFSGDCGAAFRFYGEVFGVEPRIMTGADVPPGESGMEGLGADQVMHAAIEINGGLLMGSDDPTGTGGAKTGIAVSYSAADAAEVRRVFDALAEGGTVDMPVEATFWSAAFGALTDKFGVPWMIDTAEQPA